MNRYHNQMDEMNCFISIWSDPIHWVFPEANSLAAGEKGTLPTGYDCGHKGSTAPAANELASGKTR